MGKWRRRILAQRLCGLHGESRPGKPCSIQDDAIAEPDIHVIADDCSTHEHAKVKARLAARPRRHVHLIPTCSAWPDPVERFFALTTDKAIRRGPSRSVRERVAKIDQIVSHHDRHCKPFVRTATAGSIPSKLRGPCQRINGT